jgi:iron(III) transport system substrate-binding protein
MTFPRVMVVVAFLLVLALPFLVRRSGSADAARPARTDGDTASLVIVTPHVGQIRDEFGAGFAKWHARVYPAEPHVRVDWRVPGGTSEIVKQFRAEYEAAVRAAARDGTLAVLSRSDDGAKGEVTLPARSMGADLMFGGGHYEHDQLRAGVGVRVRVEGKDIDALVRISEPAGFDEAKLRAWFPENRIGNQELYQPEQYWIGLALSGFGIVYNRELVAERGLDEPQSFKDLTAYGYRHALALADPRQSGSVTTTYESILNKEGWDEGWRILREMGANARSFASASTKPPVDVSQGEALAGLAIDFYGRAQAQSVLAAGQDPATSRVGYVDPRGAVYIDADPISVLRGCPNPVLARRFIEFCLTEEGQALWQFPPAGSDAGAGNPVGESGERMGPERYALRRMPARHAMYDRYLDHFVDRVNPFEIAAPLPDRRWRRAIDVMMGAFAVDTLDDLRLAWDALHAARADASFPSETLAEMERAFYAFPTGGDVTRLAAALFPGLRLPPDAAIDFSPDVTDTDGRNQKKDDNCRRIAATWSDASLKARLRVVYTEFFRESYRRVVELSGVPGAAAGVN